MIEYWTDCVSEGLCDAGVDATKEQVDIIADWVQGAHENYSMATGSDCIPNPENEEIAELKREIKRINAAHNRQLDGVVKGVAQRRNVSESSVNVDNDGLVTYQP